VATGCGALVAIDPWIFVCGGIVWLVFMGAFRYAGLASIAMGLAFPLAAWWRMAPGRFESEVVLGASALSLLILVRHRQNIARMRAGTEPKIGRKRGAASGG
jgi:glycerol-3-phosphate acyltransferase PlsY